MPAKRPSDQLAFRYRPADSVAGVTRSTAQRLAKALGVDETQAIHLALHEMAVRVLPQYEADRNPAAANKEAGRKGRHESRAFELV